MRSQSVGIAISLLFAWFVQLAFPAHLWARELNTFEKALVDVESDRHKEGIARLRAWLKDNPSDAEAFIILGRAYMNLDQLGDCLRVSSRAIELNPNLSRAYSLQGYCFLKQGRMQEGIDSLSKAIELYRINPFDWDYVNDLRNRAEAYRRLGQLDHHARDKKRALPFEFLKSAQDLREQGRLNESLAAIDNGLAIDSNIPDLWFFRGVLHGNKRENWLAISDYTRALKLSPDSAQLYYFRGDCYQQLAKHKEAVADFSKILALKPRIVAFKYVCETGRLRDQLLRQDEVIISTHDICFLRANSLIALNRFGEALKDLDMVIRADPKDERAYSRRAELVLNIGRDDSAIKDYSRAIALNPGDWRKFKDRADAYQRIGKYREALNDLDQIVRLNPRDPGAYLLRAVALENDGQHKRAIADYTKVVELNPNDDDAYVGRANCYTHLGLSQQALKDFAKAEELAGGSLSRVQEGRAELYSRKGDEEQARKEIVHLQEAENQKRSVELERMILPAVTCMLFLALSAAGLLLLRKRKARA
ncbi:MAG TPA: tetratricopeptide repeat protein [Candidatus Obscuribacterales bacterium]